jgi:NAD-dependent deacetylase
VAGPDASDSILALASRLRTAQRVTVLTGAGVSAASGVPTFRGPDGLWRRHRPEELATPEALARDPELVWEWYAWRREKLAACRPNPAHDVLAAWTKRSPGWKVVTQNVDDLHLRAGTRDLIRLHGSIWELSCWDGCAGTPTRWRDERVPLPEMPPRCPYCGGLARPAVVWFGESLDPADVTLAQQAMACDVFIAAGTSAVVYPAAAFAGVALSRGAFTVEINIEATPASAEVDLTLHQPAERALAEIDTLLASA